MDERALHRSMLGMDVASLGSCEAGGLNGDGLKLFAILERKRYHPGSYGW
jgi:hypothetical protein